MNSMKMHVPIARLLALSLIALLVGPLTLVSSVSAATITVKAFCNVQVTIKATVPDSIEQGKSFMMTDITVQPANTYGFNVTSSIYYMSATGTSSTNYQQNFYATNPSPTTGHNTYVSYYPNWTLNATGPVGSAVTITLNKSITVIQGYGGSPVNCNFSKTLATVPIVAASAAPSTPTTPSQPASPTSPSTKPNNSPSKSPTTSSSTPSPSTSATPQTTNTSKTTTNDSTAVAPSTSEKPVNKSVSVVPLTIEVRDHFGTTIKNAEVMLDSSKRLTTDNRGKVTFSNVLTGPHAILVSYKGQKITKNITLGDDAISKVTTVELPATPPPWPIIIGIGVTAVVLLAAATILMLRRKRSRQPDSTDTLHGVINQAVERSPSPVLSGTIPAIPMFATKSAPPPLTPWNPIPPADTPQVASTPAVAPVISETTLPLAVQPQAAPVEPPVPNISNDEPQSIQHFASEPQTAPEPPVNEMPQLPVADNEPPVQTPPASR